MYRWRLEQLPQGTYYLGTLITLYRFDQYVEFKQQKYTLLSCLLSIDNFPLSVHWTNAYSLDQNKHFDVVVVTWVFDSHIIYVLDRFSS